MQRRRNTRASNESGFIIAVASRVSLLTELVGIDNKAKANRDSCL